MLPLLFVCTSQHRPLRVRNPIRCNRRILSQPCFYRSYSPRYPFGAPLRSHLLYLSVPFLSALRNVLCKTSMINTLFLIALRILTVAQEIRTVNAVLSHYCSLQILFFSQYQNGVCRKRDRSSFAFGALLSGIKFSKQYQILCCGVTNGKSGQVHTCRLRRSIAQQ